MSDACCTLLCAACGFGLLPQAEALILFIKNLRMVFENPSFYPERHRIVQMVTDCESAGSDVCLRRNTRDDVGVQKS